MKITNKQQRIKDFFDTLNYLKINKLQRDFINGNLKPTYLSKELRIFEGVKE